MEKMLFDGINIQARLIRNMRPIREFGIILENQNDKAVGGATGVTYYGCLYIDMLWIKSDLCGKGWGTKIMQSAEQIAKERGCRFATVNTMDWEALPFYQKLGYEVEFTREGYENNSKMFFLIKPL